MEHSDQRKYKRVPYNETVIVNDSLKVLGHDISEGGLFIHLNKALLPGSMVTIQFPRNPMKFAAIAQKVPETGGLGLMFTDMDASHLAALREIISAAETASSLRKTTPTVLLVEDSDSVRKLNKTRLVGAGYSVLEAADGMDALRILGTEVPKVIILDLHMEKMDGYKVLGFLKQDEKLRDIPVIVFSSKFTNEEQEKVFNAGASEFLQKMTTPPEKLLSIIEKLIKKT